MFPQSLTSIDNRKFAIKIILVREPSVPFSLLCITLTAPRQFFNERNLFVIFPFPDLKEVLCKEYKYRASSFQPLPWIDKMQFNLKDVYTELTVVKRRKRGWEKTNKIVEPSDIFDEDEESNPRIILIEGSPGQVKQR